MKKCFGILGLGETGLASALFLKKRGFDVFVSESQISDPLEERASRLKEEKIAYELGGHTLGKIIENDWVLLSPGISPAAEIYQSLVKLGAPLVSEVEVASWFSPGEVTAVTGTSGKTTVTTLIHRIYQAHGIPSVSCGNIGNPWIGEIDRLTPKTQIVLEISSFQLQHTFSLRPRFAVLLNIGPNHLDWHPTMEDYVSAKLRLFQNQTAKDDAFVRRKDHQTFFPHFSLPSRMIYFADQEGHDANRDLLEKIAERRGLDLPKVREIYSQFEGIEHRLERVGEIDGVRFVNDSKCTTLEALVWGLNQFPDGKVILLAGGHAKGADFLGAREPLTKKAKQVIVYGEAQNLLWESWEGAAPLTRAKDLPEAFREALRIGRPGDTLLLSPACASFDQFTNYQERGRLFKQLVSQCEASSARP